MAVYNIGDMVTRACGSVGIITGFDRDGDFYVEFILGPFAKYEERTLDYARHFRHTKEEDL